MNPKAPPIKLWNGRRVASATTGSAQNSAVQTDAIWADARGATDIRIDQHQVNANGNRVGINRPDLQYTLNGQRHYIEYERVAPPGGRGLGHVDRILSNDPNGIVIIQVIP